MRAVEISVLQNELSEYVRLAAADETILVTDGDRVVAEIGPPRADRPERNYDAVVAEGVRSGWVTPRRYALGAIPLLPADRRKLSDVLTQLDWDREDPGI